MAIGDLYDSAAIHCTPSGKLYERGVRQMKEWHEVCERKRRKAKREGRWCAPEHLKRGCSFKGDALVASNLVRVTKRRGFSYVTIEYRGTIPIYGGDINKKFPQYDVH